MTVSHPAAWSSEAKSKANTFFACRVNPSCLGFPPSPDMLSGFPRYNQGILIVLASGNPSYPSKEVFFTLPQMSFKDVNFGCFIEKDHSQVNLLHCLFEKISKNSTLCFIFEWVDWPVHFLWDSMAFAFSFTVAPCKWFCPLQRCMYDALRASRNFVLVEMIFDWIGNAWKAICRPFLQESNAFLSVVFENLEQHTYI